MGIDIENDFAPAVRGRSRPRRRSLAEIKKAAKKAKRLCWRPTPTAKGRPSPGTSPRSCARRTEHPAGAVQRDHQEGGQRGHRSSPGRMDLKKFESQQARRILDRLVGYKISPVLWDQGQARAVGGPRAVGGGAAGGRARGGDPGLRRPRSTGPSTPTSRRRRPPPFVARVGAKRRGEAGPPSTRPSARAHRRRGRAGAASWSRRSSARSAARTRRRPSSPRKLQQEASSKLRFSPKRTMGWPSGSTKASSSAKRARSVSSPTCAPTPRGCPRDAQAEARDYIAGRYGAEHAARPSRRSTGPKKSAQDAHEAIRPTLLDRDRPERAGAAASSRDQLASCTAHLEPLRGLPDEPGGLRPDRPSTSTAGPYVLRATGQVIKVARLHRGLRRDARRAAGQAPRTRGEAARAAAARGGRAPAALAGSSPKQHFTQPPPRSPRRPW